MSVRISPWMFLILPALMLAFGFLRVSQDGDLQINREKSRQIALDKNNRILNVGAAKATNELAISRYLGGGCIPVDQVQQGQVYSQLPPYSQLCDQYGWTAEVNEYGEVVNLANTSNTEVVAKYFGIN
jgi:hypothetical protein